jgi:hypothetical protein
LRVAVVVVEQAQQPGQPAEQVQHQPSTVSTQQAEQVALE